MDMLLNMPKLKKKFKKLKKEGGPQFLSLTCYCIRVNGPPPNFWITDTAFEELWTDTAFEELWRSVLKI